MSPAAIEFPIEGLSDGTVRLRLIADADVPAITAACQDPEIVRYTTIPSPYELHHAREWQLRSEAGRTAGTDIGALIVDADSDGLLGSVGMHGLDPATGRAAAGYWVAAHARRQGVATRGVRLLPLRLRRARRRAHRAMDRAPKRALAPGRRARRFSQRGPAAILHAGPGHPPRHAHLLAAAGGPRAVERAGT